MAGKWKIEDFAATDRMILSYLLLRGYKEAEKGLSHDLALLNENSASILPNSSGSYAAMLSSSIFTKLSSMSESATISTSIDNDSPGVTGMLPAFAAIVTLQPTAFQPPPPISQLSSLCFADNCITIDSSLDLMSTSSRLKATKTVTRTSHCCTPRDTLISDDVLGLVTSPTSSGPGLPPSDMPPQGTLEKRGHNLAVAQMVLEHDSQLKHCTSDSTDIRLGPHSYNADIEEESKMEHSLQRSSMLTEETHSPVQIEFESAESPDCEEDTGYDEHAFEYHRKQAMSKKSHIIRRATGYWAGPLGARRGSVDRGDIDVQDPRKAVEDLDSDGEKDTNIVTIEPKHSTLAMQSHATTRRATGFWAGPLGARRGSVDREDIDVQEPEKIVDAVDVCDDNGEELEQAFMRHRNNSVGAATENFTVPKRSHDKRRATGFWAGPLGARRGSVDREDIDVPEPEGTGDDNKRPQNCLKIFWELFRNCRRIYN